MKAPQPRKWTDPKSGKEYWRVRYSDNTGKEVVRVFKNKKAAEAQIKKVLLMRKRHGSDVAVSKEEVDALTAWREFVAAESEAGRKVPPLRDQVILAINRLKAGATSPGIEDLMEQFLEAKRREKVSDRHYSALKNRLGRFVSYFDPAEASGAITTEQVEGVMSSMLDGGMSPQTTKGTREAAHGMFAWAVKRKYTTANPVSDAFVPKVLQGEVGVISPSKFKAILKTALERQPHAVPAISLWGFCGLRRAEINRLRYEDMDFDRKSLRVSARVGKKGRGKVRYVPLPDALLAWLEAAKSAGIAPIGKIVPGENDTQSEAVLNGWLVTAREDAGIEEWPHNALRHSFASYACAMTEDYPRVSAWMGHSGGTDLLEARYRHAVPIDAGVKWFSVFPPGYQQGAKAGVASRKGRKSKKS